MRFSLKALYAFMVFSYLFLACPSFAQFESLIERYTGENAKKYVEPLITAFGANLNTSIYRNAKIDQNQIHIFISLNGMVAFFSDDQRTFTARTEEHFYPPQEVETATIVGKEGAIVEGTGGTQFQFPDGYNLKSFTVGTPMITVGGFYGTEVSFRYFSQNISEDLGTVSLLGLGARHSISQYIPNSPVDIAVGYFYHRFHIGDIVKTNASVVHTEVGKSLAILDVYGGLSYGWTTARVQYTYSDQGITEDIDVTLKGKNKFQLTIGAGINLLVFHLHLDYSFGSQRVVSTGLWIGL